MKEEQMESALTPWRDRKESQGAWGLRSHRMEGVTRAEVRGAGQLQVRWGLVGFSSAVTRH